jgi:hypothetical protein
MEKYMDEQLRYGYIYNPVIEESDDEDVDYEDEDEDEPLQVYDVDDEKDVFDLGAARMSSIGLSKVYRIGVNPANKSLQEGEFTLLKPTNTDPEMVPKMPAGMSLFDIDTYRPLFRYETYIPFKPGELTAKDRDIVVSSKYLERATEAREMNRRVLAFHYDVSQREEEKVKSHVLDDLQPPGSFKHFLPYDLNTYLWDKNEKDYGYPTKYYVWRSDTLNRRAYRALCDRIEAHETSLGGIAYPGFSFSRPVPVSDEDFLNLRSDLLLYRKLIKSELY